MYVSSDPSRGPMLLPHTQTPGCVPIAVTDRGALVMITLEVGWSQGMEFDTPAGSKVSLPCCVSTEKVA